MAEGLIRSWWDRLRGRLRPTPCPFSQAAALDMNYAYSPHNPSGYGRWWGNAVLTKFEILVVLGYDKTQAAVSSAASVAGPGAGPVAAAQGTATTASSTSSSGTPAP